MELEKPRKEPERHSELHDPKLPAIHGQTSGSQLENRLLRKVWQ